MIENLKKFVEMGEVALRVAIGKNPQLLADFTQAYYEVFNTIPESCFGCPGGFSQSFANAKNYINNPMEKTESQFKIKGGGTINGIHGDYSQSNLTDDIALKLIKANPNYTGAFEPTSIPKDLDALLAKTKTWEEEAIEAQQSAQKANEKKTAAPKAETESVKGKK